MGRIIDALPENTLVIVFAVHGMGPNPGWSDLLPDILEKLKRTVPGNRTSAASSTRSNSVCPITGSVLY